MASSGLDVFDKTLQTTNIWLDGIMAELGCDRQQAWHALGAVLRTLRDRVPLELAAHLSAQLPLILRGAYYDQWHPAAQPERHRTLDEFLARIGAELHGTRPVDVEAATRAVLRTLSRHADAGQIRKVMDALPREVRSFWLTALAANDAVTPADRRAVS